MRQMFAPKASVISILITFALVTSLSACRTPDDTRSAALLEGENRPVGEFVGVPGIRQVFREQILAAGAPGTANFDPLKAVGTGFVINASLLGASTNKGVNNDFRGGTPNPVGLLLWYKVFRTFSDAVGESCASPSPNINVGGPGQVTLAADFAQAVATLCKQDSSNAEQQQAARTLWRTAIGLGAPDEELVFVEDVTAGALGNASNPTADKRVSNVLTALFMNPYFLLEHN